MEILRVSNLTTLTPITTRHTRKHVDLSNDKSSNDGWLNAVLPIVILPIVVLPFFVSLPVSVCLTS